jgi:hypothetical protein
MINKPVFFKTLTCIYNTFNPIVQIFKLKFLVLGHTKSFSDIIAPNIINILLIKSLIKKHGSLLSFENPLICSIHIGVM